MIVEAIKSLVEEGRISGEAAARCLEEIMEGRATDAQVSAFLTALRLRGETPEVIASMAEVMRRFASRIEVEVDGRLIDTCGTGGDRVKTINVSTASGLIVAACGGRVAKHGNRSFTGYSGSADFLESVGVKIDAGPEVVARCIRELGFGFIFAPRYHPSMKRVAPIRREIAIRTVFNLLGPLTNPAPINSQAMGVFSKDFIGVVAEAMRLLGREEALIYHGEGGLDEVSVFSETEIAWLRDGSIRRIRVRPEDMGLRKVKSEDLLVRSREEAVRRTLEAVSGSKGPRNPYTMLLLANSSAALIAAGLADTLDYGVEQAWETIESGRALETLRRLVRATGGDLGRMEAALSELP